MTCRPAALVLVAAATFALVVAPVGAPGETALADATGAGAPVRTGAVAEPRCAGTSLALAQTANTIAPSVATATFVVRDLGAPCTLPRVAIVHASDAAGSDVPLTAEKVRELDVILNVHVRPRAGALFTITYTPSGNRCTRVRRVRFAVGDGGIEAPASFIMCSGSEGAGAHVSFLMGGTVSAPAGPRTMPAGAASSPAPRP